MYHFELGATIERIFTNDCNAVRDCNACKPGATIERLKSNACYTVGDCNACKPGATIERITIYFCNIFGNNKFGYQFTIQIEIMGTTHRITRITSKINIAPCYKVAYVNLFKPGAFIERLISNACNAVGDCNACKPGATIERITSNACYAVRDCNACEPNANGERKLSNACNAVRDCYASKPDATTECIISNTCNAVGCTIICYTFGNYHTAGVLIRIRIVMITSVGYLNSFLFLGQDVVINTVHFKVMGTYYHCVQQQQCSK